MPLSEHEERILAEIERRLNEDDPRFVRRTRRATGRDPLGTRLQLAIAAFAVGLICLFFLTFHLAFGVAGALLMFVGLVTGASALRGGAEDGPIGDRVRRVFGSSRQDS
ncbi:MAG: DUF3040 domain-containing protein [Actinobacteria bacterium]|nr:DUF3040 domain-containing protein [Actinomycetota bacterium]